MSSSLDSLADSKLFWVIVVIAVLYYCTTYNYGYWASKGVPYLRPYPIFGNGFFTSLCIKPRYQVQKQTYDFFKGLPYGGTYEYFKPKLFLRDPGLIEQVLIKDFGVFLDRGIPIDQKHEPLANHLINLTGSRWRSLRNKLTPTFSSGKLKTMLSQVELCSDMLVEVLEKKVAANTAPLEAREQMSRFTIDVIGSCAFGLDFNALHNPNSPFMEIGRTAFAPRKMAMIRFILRSHFPRLLRLLGWKGLPRSMEEFFLKTVTNTVRQREQNNIHRNDFIQLMMEVRKQEQNQPNKADNEVLLDDSTFAANAFVFLLAGFETTATTLSYILYELGKNADIQDKLYNEVTQIMNKHNGQITWDTIKDMTYLEQIICETLRKHTPIVSLERRSVEPYTVPNSSLHLPAGSTIYIPVYCLHHDPKYFPNPDKFDPERFSEENKAKIVKGTYLPFGDGPRICIGLRFAKVEIKVATIKLISKFKFKLNPRTKDPLEYSAATLITTPIGGLWIDFIPRK